MSAPAPFSRARRIGFGDCDPARIFYAPRAVDWSVEAAEAWFEAVPGVSWAELWTRHGLEARLASADCEYSRSAFEGQVIQVRIGAALAPDGALILGALGELAPGEPSFRSRLELRLVDRGRSPVPVPPPWRERIQSYRARWGEPEALPAEPGPAPGGGAEPGPAASAPFRRRRRVLYGECGLSGEAHPPRVVDWAVEAAGEWYQSTLGVSWREQCIRGRGAPFVRIRCDYLRPVAAGQDLDLAVRIPRLGRASIGYEVTGLDAGGAACFQARMAACYITEEGGPPRAMPFPDELRRRILGYQDACRAGAAS